MLIEGCWLVGVSERGAWGFSNDRSLTYCASTASCGIAICGWGPPFVVDIAVLQPPLGRLRAWLTQGLQANNGGRPVTGRAAGCPKPDQRRAGPAKPTPHCPA